MKLVWTKSDKVLSKFIRFLTGDDCSHFAIVLYDGLRGEIMFESNLLGTHPVFYKNSLKSHTVVHEQKVLCSQIIEDAVWDNIVDNYDGRGYDYLGALYLGMRKFLNRTIGLKMPEKNAWANPDKYYCDELFEALKGVPGIPEVPVANAMKTPHDVWKLFNS